MTYDILLAGRIRSILDGTPNLTEKQMFAGLAFLINGNMAAAVSGQGGIVVRTDPKRSVALAAETPAQIMEMRGKPMPGWMRVESGYVQSDDELTKWVHMGVAYAASLPPKKP